MCRKLKMSEGEIARALECPVRLVREMSRKYGILPRGAEPPDQSGENNPNWKGDEATYAALHLRVQRLRGDPMECEKCGCTDGNFEWANRTGDYADVNDYVRLCIPCHRKYDAKRRRKLGRSTITVSRKAKQ